VDTNSFEFSIPFSTNMHEFYRAWQ